MAFGEITEFIVSSAGLALAAVAVVITLAVFAAIARLGNSARPTTDEE